MLRFQLACSPNLPRQLTFGCCAALATDALFCHPLWVIREPDAKARLTTKLFIREMPGREYTEEAREGWESPQAQCKSGLEGQKEGEKVGRSILDDQVVKEAWEITS